MKVEITAYCCEGTHDWLKTLIAEVYDDLLEKVEAHVREHKTGLPWEWVEMEDYFNPELQEGFEVSFSVDYRDEPGGRSAETGGLVSCATWMLRDFWEEESPPPEPPASLCQSKNHVEHYGKLWECQECERWFCQNEGGEDNLDLCDECWAKQEIKGE